MEEQELTPLQRAVLRNYERRRMRHWAVFRELAGGLPVPEDLFGRAAEMLRSYYESAEPDEYGCFDPGAETRHFEISEFLDVISDGMGDPIVVLLSVYDGPATHGFLAPLERTVAALSNDLTGNDVSIVDPSSGMLAQVYANATEYAMRLARQDSDGRWFRFYTEE